MTSWPLPYDQMAVSEYFLTYKNNWETTITEQIVSAEAAHRMTAQPKNDVTYLLQDKAFCVRCVRLTGVYLLIG